MGAVLGVAPAVPSVDAGPEPEVDGGLSLRRDAPDLSDLQKGVAPAELEPVEDLSLGKALFQTVVVLGLVILLAWFTLNVGLRRLLGIQAPQGGPPVVQVLERVALDQKRTLFVVRAGSEVLLIGGSDASLGLITKLDPLDVEKARALAPQPLKLKMSPFLQKLLGRKDAAPPPPKEPPP
jgi:flagellar protein FliO/FliZ